MFTETGHRYVRNTVIKAKPWWNPTKPSLTNFY